MRWTRQALAVGMMLSVVVAHMGCAAPRPTSAQVTVSDAERLACENLVRAESAAAEQAAKEAAARRAATQPSISGAEVLSDAASLVLLAPFLPFGVMGYLMTEPFYAIGRAGAKTRAHEAAVNDCLGYVIQAATLGPDAPEVAKSLVALAIRQGRVGHPTEAEALFRRALDIYKRSAPGTDSGGQVDVLETYAEFLRGLGRESQAVDLYTRARAIREMFEPKASFTPASWDFGLVEVGTTSPVVTFTLTNTGGRPFEIEWAGATGIVNTQSDSCSNVTMDPGGTCVVALHIASYTAGAREEVLRARVTGSGLAATVKAALRWTGVAPPESEPAGGPKP